MLDSTKEWGNLVQELQSENKYGLFKLLFLGGPIKNSFDLI